MSSCTQARCVHCSSIYTHWQSGSETETNTHPYCKDCFEVVAFTLQAIPVRCVPAWKGTLDVSVEFLVEHTPKPIQQPGFPVIRRLAVSLIDMACPTNKNCRGYVRYNKRTYMYDYWTKRGGMALGRVFIQVSIDPVTKEIRGPWSLLDQWDTPPVFVDYGDELPPYDDPNEPLLTFESKACTKAPFPNLSALFSSRS